MVLWVMVKTGLVSRKPCTLITEHVFELVRTYVRNLYQ